MKVIGLTGGIGSGKSTTDKFLRERGVPVVDTDVLARELVEPGEPALAEISQAFGSQLIGPDGRLRRHELAEIAFREDSSRSRLEAILHPRIRERWESQIEGLRSEGRHSVAVVVIPLLYETGAKFDTVICVACSPTTQGRRLAARNWSEAHIDQRLRAQWPIPKKMELADFVIWTEGSLEVHSTQLDRILAAL